MTSTERMLINLEVDRLARENIRLEAELGAAGVTGRALVEEVERLRARRDWLGARRSVAIDVMPAREEPEGRRVRVCWLAGGAHATAFAETVEAALDLAMREGGGTRGGVP